jgi:hypothetical protein
MIILLSLFLKESYNYLKKAINSKEIYPEAKDSFSQIISLIEQQVNNSFLNSKIFLITIF